jgi:DNA-binding response OmpR family regulator
VVRGRRPDLVVLDLGLPGLDGMEVACILRRESDLPIIMLTARVQEEDRLVGLEVGADDYITKPFSPRELVARVTAVLRRAQKNDDQADIFRVADLTIDEPAMRVTRGKEAIELSPTEFRVLVTLARHAGRVYTRWQIVEAVHGSRAEVFDRAIDSQIKNIRRKLERNGPADGVDYIHTIYGIGYKFSDA